MKAYAVWPGDVGRHGLMEVEAPVRGHDEALVRVLEVGVDGTDRELIAGEYGEAPPGSDYLIIGHESLGEVLKCDESGANGLAAGDLVVAIVRRPDPEPCEHCAAGEWDMCSNGRYTERGIKGAHGFLTERYVEAPAFLVKVPAELRPFAVLLEPLSIVEKALEQIERIQQRLAKWEPRHAVVLGAGTIGTLATLLLRLLGIEVHVYSRGEGRRGRQIAESAGARYLDSTKWRLDHDLRKTIGDIDIIIEATGYSPLAFDATDAIGPNGIVCLAGVSGGSRKLTIDSSHLNLEMVLMNKVAFGTVNANRRHFEAGVKHMREIEARWPGLLSQFITQRVKLDDIDVSFLSGGEDLKAVVEVGA